jgi:hypothetical protein
MISQVFDHRRLVESQRHHVLLSGLPLSFYPIKRNSRQKVSKNSVKVLQPAVQSVAEKSSFHPPCSVCPKRLHHSS